MPDLADKIRRGDDLTPEERLAVFKEADAAGILYYKMLSMVRDQRALTKLPETLKDIIKTGAWRRWRWVGSSFGQNSLGAYLTSPPPNGVGINLDTVEKLVADDPEALALYREEMTGEPHVRADADIISIKPKHGTAVAYTLDRLRRERPDLFERVKAKKLSANAAAIEAGWRKPPSPLLTLRRAWKRASAEERQAFLAELRATT